MKITRLMAILFAILSLALVLTLVGCQDNSGDGGNEVETNAQDVCKHESTYVNTMCEKVCVECRKVLETDLHGLTVVNAKCQEVCSVCGKVYKTDVHDAGAINDECQRTCIRCGVVCETDLHDEKIINDKCEEVCGRCGKVYATGKHDAGAYGENCDKSCTRCGTTLATGEHGETTINNKCEEVCVRCGKVMATGVHAEKIVNDKLQEVCSRCGEVYVECVHDKGVVENCVKSCGNCGVVLDAEAHGEKIINDNCDEVCADCGKVYATDVHAELVVGDDCVKSCSRCGDVVETEAHGELVITANCEQVCSVCSKVFAKDVHDVSVETYVDDYFTNTRTYAKACARCGGNAEYVYTVQFGAKKPEVFVNAAQLASIGMGDKFEKTVLSADGTYATFTGKAGKGDAAFYPFIGDGSKTGQYVIIKYRTDIQKNWEFFVSAGRGKTGAAAGENFYYVPTANGEWQVVVFDLSKLKSSSIVAKNENGEYAVDYLRWDIFDAAPTGTATVDVAYIGFADSITELTATCPDVETVAVITGSVSGGKNSSYDVYPESGTAAGSGTNVPGVAKPYFKFNFDLVNGGREGVLGGHINMLVSNLAMKTAANGKFVITGGWAGAYDDIAKYQYSTDDGVTWNDFAIAAGGRGAYDTAEAAVIAAISGPAPAGMFAGVTVLKNGRFSGLEADLSEYYGQTVSFTFAVVLENGDRLSMAKYNNVTVGTCSHASTSIDENCYRVCNYCKEALSRHDVTGQQWIIVEGRDENGDLLEEKLCTRCGERGATRELFYVSCCDGVKIDGITVNPSERNAAQTVGFGLKDANQYATLDGANIVAKNGNKLIVTNRMNFSGWCAVNGGVARYVVKIDNGTGTAKWVTMSGNPGTPAAGSGIYNAIAGFRDNILDVAASTQYANYQGQLSVPNLQAFGGQTVNITFGAVPAANPGTEDDPNVVTFAELTNVEIVKITDLGKPYDSFNVTIAEGDEKGSTYVWNASAPGDLLLTFPTVEGVNYSYSISSNNKPGVVVTQEDAIDGTVAFKVASGDRVIINVVTEGAKALETTVGIDFNCYASGADVALVAITGTLTQSRDADGNLVVTAKSVPSNNDANFTFFSDGEIKIPGRYLLITYKTTNTDINAVHLQGHKSDGTAVGWVDFGNIVTNKDGQWHTAVIDVYSMFGNESTVRVFRIDACEHSVGQSITFKDFKFVDDLAAANSELGGPLWSYSGEELTATNLTRLTNDANGDGKADRDAEGNLIISSTENGDSFFTVIRSRCTARYIAITVKAGDADSTLGQIYVVPRGDGVKNQGGAPVENHVGQWVTVIIDVRNYLVNTSNNDVIGTLRLDCCDNGGTLTIKSIAGFGDLNMAVASAGDNPVYGVAVTLPE